MNDPWPQSLVGNLCFNKFFECVTLFGVYILNDRGDGASPRLELTRNLRQELDRASFEPSNSLFERRVGTEQSGETWFGR